MTLAQAMPAGAAQEPPGRAVAQGGFTLLELLVVIAIIALATAGVGLALRDSGAAALQREGERLAALLEAARAQSRASGAAVRWRADAQGFQFEGLVGSQLPRHWLDSATSVRGPATLWLGPEPLIGAQQVLIDRRLGRQSGRPCPRRRRVAGGHAAARGPGPARCRGPRP